MKSKKMTFCWAPKTYEDDFVSFELSKLFETDLLNVGVVPDVASQGNVGKFVVQPQKVQRLSQMTLKVFAL